MRILANLILTNIFLLGVCWLALRYGRPTGNRWLDRLNRFISTKLPCMFFDTIRCLFGDPGVEATRRLYKYVLNERNPLTMILYIIITIGGYMGFVVSGYPHLPNNTLTFPYHKEMGFVIFCASLYFFNLAAVSNPGIIAKSNHANHYRLFPFDDVVYKQDIVCSTCKFSKPARSKHCRFCGIDIARFDHHCVWINQCVGLGNIKPFLLFLLSNNVMCIYGGFLGIGILYDLVHSQGLHEAWFQDASGQRFKASPYYIFVYLVGTQTLLCYVTIIAIFMGTFLSFFTWYHWVTLMREGITTNEESKLSRLDDIARKKFIKKYAQGSWWNNLKYLWTTMCPPLVSIKQVTK